MKEKMSNVCEECRYHKNNRCMLPCYTINHPAENSACHRFEVKTPPTNGDVIRQGGDYALAHFKSEHRCNVCAYAAPIDTAPACRRPEGKVCFDGMLAWLNAPADCVKQNGNDDTQTDLCKADNTESEGEDEIN